MRLEIKVGQIILQKHILKKIEIFPEMIKARKQLERFPRCLAYTSGFIKELAKLRKPLQQKLKKEVSWTWTPSDSNIVQNFKKIYTNFHALNLFNEGDDLIHETNASNERWSTVLKIKEKNSANIAVEILIR